MKASKDRKVLFCGALISLAIVLAVATWLFRERGTAGEYAERIPSAARAPSSAEMVGSPGHSPNGTPDAASAQRPSRSNANLNQRDDFVSQPPEDSDEARAWTRSHLEAALVWLVDASPGPQRDAVLEIACLDVAQFKPAEAARLADRYGGGRMDLLENIVQRWAPQDAATAQAYALGKPPGEMRNRLLSRVALERAKRNPAEAAKLAINRISPGDIQTEAIIAVLQKWIGIDQNAATEWVLSFPAGELRERAVRELARSMAFADD